MTENFVVIFKLSTSTTPVFSHQTTQEIHRMTSIHTVREDKDDAFIGETESLRTARTILGHYFAMANGIDTNAELCLDKVRDRFWKWFYSITLIIITLISSQMILPILTTCLTTCIFAVWTFVYMHKSLTEYMRPTDEERVVAEKWIHFLKIASRFGLIDTLASEIRYEPVIRTQVMILSGNKFSNPWFREKILEILQNDEVPETMRRMHGRLLLSSLKMPSIRHHNSAW